MEPVILSLNIMFYSNGERLWYGEKILNTKLYFFVCSHVFKKGLGEKKKTTGSKFASAVYFLSYLQWTCLFWWCNQKIKSNFEEENVWLGTFPWQSQRLAPSTKMDSEEAQGSLKTGCMRHRLKCKGKGRNGFLLCKYYQ